MISRWVAAHRRTTLLTRTVAAHGLAGSTWRSPHEPLPAADFDDLHAPVRRQRLTGLLWAAVRQGAMPVTQDAGGARRVGHVESLAGVLALEHLLLDSVATLTAAEIPTRVLKGPVVAHLDYPDPTWRTFGDIDLLVRGATSTGHAVC